MEQNPERKSNQEAMNISRQEQTKKQMEYINKGAKDPDSERHMRASVGVIRPISYSFVLIEHHKQVIDSIDRQGVDVLIFVTLQIRKTVLHSQDWEGVRIGFIELKVIHVSVMSEIMGPNEPNRRTTYEIKGQTDYPTQQWTVRKCEMVRVMHHIHSDLREQESYQNCIQDGVSCDKQVDPPDRERDEKEYFDPHNPVISSFLFRQKRLNSLFHGFVEFRRMFMSWLVVLNHSDQVLLRRSSLNERERMVALPMRSAVSTSSVVDDPSAWMLRYPLSDIINLAIDYNPGRSRGVVSSDLIPVIECQLFRIHGTNQQILFMIESKYWLHEPEYDLSRFYQRLRYGNDVANPIRFFTAPFALAQAKKTIEHYRSQDTQSKGHLMVTPNQLKEFREAQKIVASVIHPDTGQPINVLGRVSGFVVVNVPLSFMLLMTSPTTFNILFSQWMNQTYNSYMNYSNRNATSLYTNQDVLVGYASAVIVAGTLSLGGQRLFQPWIQRFRTPGSQRVARTVFTIIAVASAGFANLVMMRRKEINAGISVYSQTTGEELGKSKVAAKKAVFQTGLSRPLLSSTMFIPSGGCYLLEKFNLMPKRKAPKLVIELALCGVGLYLGLLMAISCFPQQGTLARSALEPEIVAKMKEDTHVSYNKGL